MPRFDPDTIAALAEGRLDPERARELERAIAADPALTYELAAHRAALTAVAAASIPTLTANERSGLHTAVAAALSLEESPASPERAPARRVPWTAIATAAATLIAIAAIVPLTGLLSSNSSTATIAPAAIEVSSTTAASFAGLAADTSAESGDASAESTEAPTVPDLAGVAPMPTTTVAGTTIQTATADAADTRARVADEVDKASTAETVPTAADDTTPCVTEGRTDLGTDQVYMVQIQDASGRDIVVLYTVAENGSVVAQGYDPADCTVVVTYP